MRSDAFSKCHPLVNFIFFVGAIGFGVVIQHPAYIAVGVLCAGCYACLLSPRKGWKTVLGLVPVVLFVAAINPCSTTREKRSCSPSLETPTRWRRWYTDWRWAVFSR